MTIDLGFINIHLYSIMLILGMLVASFVISKEAKRQNISKDFIVDLLFWTVILGIIGARIYYVVFNIDYYKDNLSEIYKLWHGGLAIHGGILFGLLFIIFYTKKYKIATFKILDIVVVGLIIAQAIGRWGNFFNMEAYGNIVSQSFLHKLWIPQFVIDGMYINGDYHLPTFYLESISCLIGFVILLIFRRRKNTKIGQTISLYLIMYAVIRFIIEIFRTDSLMLLNLKMAQIVSIIMFVLGIILFIISSKKHDFYNKEE